MLDLVVVGAGGFGRETLDIVSAWNLVGVGEPFNVVGVADDFPTAPNLGRLTARGVPFLGTVRDVLARGVATHYLVGIGDGVVRARIAETFDDAGWLPGTVIHPAAVIGSRVRIGDGAIIGGGVQISTNVELGRHVHLNPNATIGHDAVLADFVSVNPGAIVSGEVWVGARALIGAGAVVLQGLVVGEDATVGAAACVTRDVARTQIVKGVPAR